MILDKLLIGNLGHVGQTLLNKANLSEAPKNIIEMNAFLEVVKKSIEDDQFEGTLLGNIFFHFVSSKEIRDRNVTSRTFEDIFSGLFSQKCTDNTQRNNPPSIPALLELDSLCLNDDWKISTDLSGNKREKSDLNIGNYSISLKTLKGQAFNEDDELLTKEDKRLNDELNVGSLSYRALLKGLMNQSDLDQLSDRKKGLGSKKQIKENVIDPIIKCENLDKFKSRLALFLDYVYDDDVYIVLKSDYRITFYLIPRDNFIKVLTKTLDDDIDSFLEIFYRWENNNLRLKWVKMLQSMDKHKLNYYSTSILLKNSIYNTEFKQFKDDLSSQIQSYIEKYLTE